MEKKLFKNIVVYQIVLTIVVSIIVFFVISGVFSFSFFLGSSLSIINFLLLIFLVTKIFHGEPKTQIIYASLFMIKLSALAGVIFLLFRTNLFKLDVLGFIVGISTLFIVIIVASVLHGGEISKEFDLTPEK